MADLVGAVFVPDPWRTVLEVVGQALVEDVSGQRDVGVGGEHLGAGGKADVPPALTVPILRSTEAAGRIKRVGLGHCPAHQSFSDPSGVRRLTRGSPGISGVGIYQPLP